MMFRTANRPGGNVIVERNHRIMKIIAERIGIKAEEATFWYNIFPKNGINPRSVPYRGVLRYKWRYRIDGMKTGLLEKQTMFKIGERMWVKL